MARALGAFFSRPALEPHSQIRTTRIIVNLFHVTGTVDAQFFHTSRFLPVTLSNGSNCRSPTSSAYVSLIAIVVSTVDAGAQMQIVFFGTDSRRNGRCAPHNAHPVHLSATGLIATYR